MGEKQIACCNLVDYLNPLFTHLLFFSNRAILSSWFIILYIGEFRIPDENGWKDKNIRILADEISFLNQAIVILPSIEILNANLSSNSTILDKDNNNSNQNLNRNKNLLNDEFLNIFFSLLLYAYTEYESMSVSISGIGNLKYIFCLLLLSSSPFLNEN